MADAFPLLRRCHLFISVADDDLRELATHFVLVEAPADEYVFKQGDPADGFYMIQSGQVEVTITNAVNGKARRLSTLVEGDYFGEYALVRRGLRSASVKALKPLKLFKLTNTEFDEFVFGNARVKPNLEAALRSRAYARQANFKWLTPNEIVYIVTLRHPVFLLTMIWKSVALVLLAVGAAVALWWYSAPGILLWAPILMLLAGAGWFVWDWVDFHNDWYVVTNQRVVDIDKVALFYDSRAEAPLPIVQNTALKTTELGRRFGYGDVIINTFSGPVTFHNVPHPQAIADMILEQVNRSRVQQRMLEKQALKSTLRLAIGLDKPPEKPAPPPAKKPSGPLGFFKQFSFRMREQRGDSVIYHKHPVVLLNEVGGWLAGIAIVMGLIAIGLTGQLGDWIWLYLGVLVIILVFLINVVVYEYFDWQNDIYMVTPTQIIDVAKKPFGNEQRKAANLDVIMNISYSRPGLVYQLLNYGTVTIQAGPGGEMKFFDVYDPLSVQQDIYRRKEALTQAKAASATRQRVEELGQYLTAFYEIMEDERKKREGS